jgi:uncharacterized protein YndB with AHSA1/START domain
MDIDIVRLVGAVDREVVSREHDGKPAHAVIATRTYDTTIDDLWDALTNAERIPRWFLPVSGDLRLGGRYQLEGNAGGEVTACDPPKHLAVTWEFGGDVSWLDVRLTEDGDGTRLRLEHLAHEGPHWGDFGPGAVGIGWDLALVGLDLHVPGGATVDRVEAEAWTGSPDGVDFMTRSNEAWCLAEIAAGTPEDVARAAAARTIAAYTAAPDPGASGASGADEAGGG